MPRRTRETGNSALYFSEKSVRRKLSVFDELAREREITPIDSRLWGQHGASASLEVYEKPSRSWIVLLARHISENGETVQSFRYSEDGNWLSGCGRLRGRSKPPTRLQK